MTASTSFALRRTMPAVWIHADVMQVQIGRQDVHLVAEFGAIIDSMPTHGRPVVCIVNGQYIPRCDWWQPARPGDVILWQDVAGGGDSNPLRLILTIALIWAAPYLGPALGIAEAGTFANAVVTAAAVAAGSLAINALLPPPVAGGFGGGLQQSPTYSFALQGNQARMGQPIPVQFGQELCTPDYGSQPYVEYDGNGDQFFCANLIVGMGEHDILAIEIDDTDLRNFADVACVRVGPNQASLAGPYSGVATFVAARSNGVDDRMVSSVEVAGQELKNGGWTSALTLNRAGTLVNRVFFDVACPRGLGTILPDGSIATYGVTWQMALRRINDAGQAIDAWEVIAQENLTLNTTDTVRRSFGYDVVAGRYQARMRRLTARIDNGQTLNDFSWIGLRGRLNVDGIQRTDITGISVRIRANEQLSGLSQRRINILARRRVPVYDPDTEAWSAPQVTRNPAWALAEIWRNTTYGRGLPDSRIDLDSLVELAEVWDARQDRFDFRFDTRRSTDEAALVVALAGRAKPILRRGAIYSVVRDQQQTAPVAAYMPRNMDKDSFSLAVTLPTSKTVDTAEVTYRDGQIWSDKVVYGQIHNGAIYAYPKGSRPSGVPAPTNVQAFRLEGVVGRSHALRDAAFLAACGLYLRERASWRTDLDGLLPTFGSLIGTAHDVAGWGQSGDVVSWDADDLVLEVTEPLQFGAGTSYVRLVDHYGVPGAAIVATPGASPRQMVLAEAPGFAPSTNEADRERTRYLFGALADVQRYGVVRAVKPQSQDAVVLDVVMEDDRRHAADNAFLPRVGEIQDELSDRASNVGPDPVDYVVQVDDDNGIYDPDGSADQRIAVYEFRSDGTLYLQVHSTNEYLVPDQWLAGGPYAVSVAALFEIRAHVVSGAFGGSSAPADVWLSLATTRRFEPAGGSPCVFTVEIRDAATQTLQDFAGLRIDP